MNMIQIFYFSLNQYIYVCYIFKYICKDQIVKYDDSFIIGLESCLIFRFKILIGKKM